MTAHGLSEERVDRLLQALPGRAAALTRARRRSSSRVAGPQYVRENIASALCHRIWTLSEGRRRVEREYRTTHSDLAYGAGSTWSRCSLTSVDGGVSDCIASALGRSPRALGGRPLPAIRPTGSDAVGAMLTM